MAYQEIFPSVFISANSKDGFFSLYDNVFDTKNFHRIYILFGGPGTGKSTFLRALAEKAKKRGAWIEEILCSSDPDSLDGVILQKNGIKIGVLDGTPPHARTITLPAVCEELIDLGAFWDKNSISENKSIICALKEEKGAKYASAYRYLSAMGMLWEEYTFVKKKHFDKEKAKRQILHKIHTLKEKGGKESRFLRAFSTLGEVRIPIYEEGLQNLLLISGSPFAAEIYLSYFEELAKENKIAHTVFLSPLSPKSVDALYLKENKTLLIKEDLWCGNTKGRRIIADRFFPGAPEDTKEQKNMLNALLSHALHALQQAGSAHAAIEKCYISGMDFEALRAYREKTIEEILSDLTH